MKTKEGPSETANRIASDYYKVSSWDSLRGDTLTLHVLTVRTT